MYDCPVTVTGPPPAVLDTLAALDRVGRALSDGTRRRILLHLAGSSAYPADLADALDASRPAVSNHLACLRDCGLVVAEPEGRRVRYRLADERLAHALTDLAAVRLVAAPGHEAAR
jgi:DNA-binding transcriptional ArsR family regulator